MLVIDVDRAIRGLNTAIEIEQSRKKCSERDHMIMNYERVIRYLKSSPTYEVDEKNLKEHFC